MRMKRTEGGEGVDSKRTQAPPHPALLGPGPFLCSCSNVFFKYLATAASLLIRGGKESKHNYRRKSKPWSQDEKATQNGLWSLFERGNSGVATC